ncbi:MAG: hypothetical protein MUC38_10630 [Cyclobacteriaceae bacterium]|nr:hypothetical protein [Cyclobacteriaceae bacterium]
MKRAANYITAIAGMLTLAACGTVSMLQNHWFDPSSAIRYRDFQKVLVVAFVGNETGRRTTEAQVAQALGRLNSVPSHTYPMGNAIVSNGELVKSDLLKNGFDGALIIRLIDKQKEERWIPGSIQPMPMMVHPGVNAWGMHGFGAMWASGWNTWNNPGHMVVDKTYFYEVNLYDLQKDNIRWSGITSTMNPTNFVDKIASISETVINQMKRDGAY